MRKTIFTALVIGLIAMVSCKKDKETNEVYDPDPVPSPNYFPLAIGNYWVYENYKVENHQETLLEKLDSLRITRDTIIGGETFYILEGVRTPSVNTFRILRDSSDNIIDEKGDVYFADVTIGMVYFNHTEFDNNGDTVYNVQYKNQLVSEQIHVPLGDFDAINRVTEYITFPQSDISDSLKYRTVNCYFIDGIGQATDAIFYAGAPYHTEKRLVRYHIEDQP